MTAELLPALEARGIEVWVEGSRLRFRAPEGALTPELRDALRTGKDTVIETLRRRATSTVTTAPLSYSQRSLWFLAQQAPDTSAYNLSFSARVHSAIDVGALRRALFSLVDRHAMLRTTYETVNGEPRLRTIGAAEPAFAHMDASTWSEAELYDRVRADSRVPFDLAEGPVFRATLYTQATDEHAILLCAHHIALDGWSLLVLIDELKDAYLIEAGLGKPTLPRVEAQYVDFTREQLDRLSGPSGERAWEFWRTMLHGARTVLELPTDRPRPPVQRFAGDHVDIDVDAPTAEGLRALARAHGTTLYVVLLAAYDILLYRYTGQDDLIVGTPTFGRTRQEYTSLVGDFVDTIPLRARIDPAAPFTTLLHSVRTGVLEALTQEAYPLPLLVERLQPARDLSRTPLIQTAFALQKFERFRELQDLLMPGTTPTRTKLGALEFSPFPIPQGEGQFDLSLQLGEKDGTLHGGLMYDVDLFDEATVRRMGELYVTLLREIVAHPETEVRALPSLSPSERVLLLQAWNATDADYPDELATSRLIEAQVARTPTAVAVTADDDSVSYAELDARANRIARHLLRAGARRGAVVGICMQRTPDLVAAMLGVQKSGATYLPIDPYFPPERVSYMLADSGATLLITDPVARERLEVPSSVVVVDVVRDAAMIAEYAPDVLADAPAPEDAAYVIYTSGSTGRPKGVVVHHGALVNFLWSMTREPGITSDDVLAAVTTVSFDISGLELYLPLLVGAQIVLVPREVAADGERLTALLDSAGATMLQATPSTWRLLLESGWQGSGNFCALTGGEGLPPDVAEALHGRVGELWNLYGPTETTIWSTVARIESGTRITIGRPIANTRVYVLDAHRQLTPIGVPGELWIGGVGVAQGYHGRQELTEERFVPDPFAGNGSRMYRTGDRARWLSDGTLEHLGRLDNQVKIRGYRIELGEIEAALAAFPGVRQVVVAPRSAGSGDVRLVAYVVYETGQDASASDIRRALRRALPDYMVPSLFVSLNELPLTPNGKVDRNALPDPFRDAQPDRGGQAKMPPAPGLETVMADIWRTMLQVDDVGAEDNFFELGGHSLLALRVTATVHAQTGWRMDPRVLFFQHLRQIVASAPASARSLLLRPELAPA
jgi:amino acid adenylation domain-containing protein